MNGIELLKGINQIDDDLIEDAEFTVIKKKRFNIKRLVSVVGAALLVGVIVYGIISASVIKRISYNSDSLGEILELYIDNNTKVINTSTETFPKQMPIYRISEHKITSDEYRQTLRLMGIDEDNIPSSTVIRYDGNKLIISLADPVNSMRGYYDMTDEELEKLSWKIFKELPFIEGTYEYAGIKSTYTRSDSKGKHIVRAGVSFYKVIDGIRITGSEQCRLYFDGSGLVEMCIELYDYRKMNTINIVPLESASERIKTPDSFVIETDESTPNIEIADMLHVEKVVIRYVNQYSRNCTVLQPVYCFIGNATDKKGVQNEFKSIVIAIPDSYTYEDKQTQ